MTTVTNKGPLGWRSSFFAVGSFITVLLVSSSDEFVVGAPFILMNQIFGWWGGFFASMLIWLAVGFVSLGIFNYVWPPFWSWIKDWEKHLRIIVPFGAVTSIALITAVYLYWTEILDFISWEVVAVLLIAAIAFLFLMSLIRVFGQRFVDWSVDRISSTSSRWKAFLKPVVILMVLVYMGPALSHPVLSLPVFNVTRRSVYWLTVLAAPCFTIVWYTFYTGVWNTLTERILNLSL